MHPFAATLATVLVITAPMHSVRNRDVDTQVRRIVVARAETLAVTIFAPDRANASPSNATSRPTIVLLPSQIGSVFSMRHITGGLLTRGYAVAVIDALGMGVSARPGMADYSLTAQARRIDVVLDSLALRHVVLVGQGTSASIAYRLASHDTARVHALLSIAGGPVDRQATSGVRLALALSILIDTPIGRAFARRKFSSAMREHSADTQWCTAAVLAAYLAPYEHDLRGSLRALRGMNDASESELLVDRLPHIRVPVRLLIGDKPTADRPTTPQIAMLTVHVSNFRVDTVRAAGAMLNEERAGVVVDHIVALAMETTRPRAP